MREFASIAGRSLIAVNKPLTFFAETFRGRVYICVCIYIYGSFRMDDAAHTSASTTGGRAGNEKKGEARARRPQGRTEARERERKRRRFIV